MRPRPRHAQSLYALFLHPKHATRIPAWSGFNRREWARAFHASTSWRSIDLAYDLHDNGGKATGAPILILHGLFGSKKNNRSISKSVAIALPRFARFSRFLKPSPSCISKRRHPYRALLTVTALQSSRPRSFPSHLCHRSPQSRRIGP